MCVRVCGSRIAILFHDKSRPKRRALFQFWSQVSRWMFEYAEDLVKATGKSKNRATHRMLQYSEKRWRSTRRLATTERS